jgi:hypothetical protein
MVARAALAKSKRLPVCIGNQDVRLCAANITAKVVLCGSHISDF